MKLSKCLVASLHIVSLCDFRELLEKMVKLVLLVLWAPRYVVFQLDCIHIAYFTDVCLRLYL